ncbi:MAG: type II toxin-antitoxin system RelE/ParE family toxin [Leptolyngbya sp. SIO4C1]|nr:type II toxin-antitoxin system RelE/ParE family toxin [Leptolyngbya sp. SIO4C1]
MQQLIWTRQARADLQHHYDYLLSFNQQSALRALRAIVKAARQLASTPELGVVIDKNSGLRKWPVAFGKTGYVIYYISMSGQVIIARVYHGRQSRPY